MAPEPVPAPERGATRIADRVIAKIAAQAAHEALRRGPWKGHGGPQAPQAPHATVIVRKPPGKDGDGGQARVRVAVELGYPSDIGAQCGAVRRRVTARVGELTGMAVPDVIVDVERLHSAHLHGEGRGRVR
ncbi:Asp23/Gls24 family envelope stress response protein [Streptomyces gobiensis]|uniref:Asp23/Gls24 family envelope stress response protein n=1 Tax=Streptomyces gobiensis TaxID=2875706 RepID=UPI001E5C2D3B|nr:Asp23/Gls24 family envelope stress response protein [Streptomyces gobiensis]UGY90661.1 Asp23/Gls24 family envelope stress response protein [Streptomyces gobiensis]